MAHQARIFGVNLTEMPITIPQESTLLGYLIIQNDINITLTDFEKITEAAWFNGPDETIGYVIARTINNHSQPNFWRSNNLSEADYCDLVNYLLNSNYNNGNTADAALKTNYPDYWSSWTQIKK